VEYYHPDKAWLLMALGSCWASITFSFAEQSQCVVALPENDQLSANNALSLSQLAGRRLIAPRNCAGAMKKR